MTTLSALFLGWLRNKAIKAKESIEKKSLQHKEYVIEAQRLAEWNNEVRAELRAEILQLKTEIDGVERDLDVWKEKYFKLYEEFIVLKTVAETLQEALNDSRA